MVIPQQSAQALLAFNVVLLLSDFLTRFDQVVVKALVISFLVIMKKVLGNSFALRPLEKEYHLRQALFFYGTVEPFQMGVQIGTFRRE